MTSSEEDMSAEAADGTIAVSVNPTRWEIFGAHLREHLRPLVLLWVVLAAFLGFIGSVALPLPAVFLWVFGSVFLTMLPLTALMSTFAYAARGPHIEAVLSSGGLLLDFTAGALGGHDRKGPVRRSIGQVTDVLETQRVFVLGNRQQAIAVIPKRNFASAQDRDRFRRVVAAWRTEPKPSRSRRRPRSARARRRRRCSSRLSLRRRRPSTVDRGTMFRRARGPMSACDEVRESVDR